MFLSEKPDFSLFAATTYKTKNDFKSIGQIACGLKQSVERVTRAVIARIHYNELFRKAMLFSKESTSRGIILYRVCMRPGCEREQLFFRNSASQDAVAHEPIQHNNLFRMFEAVTQKFAQDSRGKRMLFEPPGRHCLIRIEVHHPEEQLATFQAYEE